LPNSRLVVLETAPHFLIWEHASRFNEEVFNFLSKRDASNASNDLYVTEVAKAGR
jgi:hypothetical protein